MMYGEGLVFPKLVVVDYEAKNAVLYRLDWSGKDAVVEQRDVRRRQMVRKRHDVEVEEEEGRAPTRLPEPYETMLDAARFAVPPHYEREIQHCIAMAQAEWAVNRSFDTIIREACLKPAIAYVETTFMLLDDCLHDPERKRDEHPLYIIGQSTMLYRFWLGQCGGGNYQRHAKIDRLRDNALNARRWSDEWRKRAQDFVDAIDGQFEEWKQSSKKQRAKMKSLPGEKT